MANNYSNHNIYKWAIESLSCLVAASIEEDQYGFVQQRIAEVIAALLDLLAVSARTDLLKLARFCNGYSVSFAVGRL